MVRQTLRCNWFYSAAKYSAFAPPSTLFPCANWKSQQKIVKKANTVLVELHISQLTIQKVMRFLAILNFGQIEYTALWHTFAWPFHTILNLTVHCRLNLFYFVFLWTFIQFLKCLNINQTKPNQMKNVCLQNDKTNIVTLAITTPVCWFICSNHCCYVRFNSVHH